MGIFLYYLLLCCCIYAQAENIDQFAQALKLTHEQALKEEQEKDKQFDQEFKKLVDNSGKDQPILTSFENIYQINAPEQENMVGCGFLTFRNAYEVLYALHINNFLNFIQNYYLTKNPQEFCSLKYKGGVTFADMRAVTLEKKFEPLKDRVVYFYSSDPRTVLDPHGAQKNPATKQYENIITDLGNMIKTKENNNAFEELAIRTAIVYASISNDYNGYQALKDNIKKLNDNKDYYFAIITTSAISEPFAHAILLIIHKKENVIRYYFMDPSNYLYTHTKSVGKRYRTAINRLMLFIKYPNKLDNAMVRYLSYLHKDNDVEFKKAIRQYNLENDEIYQVFYS